MGRPANRNSYDYLMEQDRKTQVAWQIYEGKLALLQTYETLGIAGEYRDALSREVRRRQHYLKVRAAL